ncbi:hypothetical protein [Alkalihalobacillus trypoxylicola]|uniref:Uncharacterized protein n=1 Tax=Alkalihalobacillus trypoxylicola TaxID=519424 RepID=A0A162D570_9BACI|nr:hypothetical protein [Alkalihalobacillus trypoxylicola]KYG28142.1 hypothetical protein AZF04_09570 [Alkalihalobacillus trypoxylicola]
MEVYVVLYEHYLQDHRIDVVGVFENISDAEEAWKKAREDMDFRDECWTVTKDLNRDYGKERY